MADVETSPQQPQPLGTMDTEESTEAAEVPQTDEGLQNGAKEDMSKPKRDSPEGSGQAAADSRLSPGGLQQDSVDAKPDETLAGAGDEGAESQPPAEGAPDAELNETVSKDPVQVPGSKEGKTEERGSVRDEERAEGDGEGMEQQARGGGEGEEEGQEKEKVLDENQPPPTPTFSSDHDEQDMDDINRQQLADEALAAEARAEAAELADTTAALGYTQSPAIEVPANATKRLTNTPLEGAGLPLKPPTAQLPPVARGQVRGEQMTSAISDALKHRMRPSPKQLIRSRRPPKYIRLATVTVSPARARQLPQGPSLYYEEPRRPKKVITWDEATNARPPLRIDMEGPTACSYTPRVKPLNETNAPSFTFGSKCYPEKTGGSRTSWTKSWFQTPHVWNNKVDFVRDTLWPSPNHYPKGSSLGPRQRTMPEAPSFTFGHKMAYSIVKPGAPKEPSPNEYKRQLADKLVLKRGPSFTHQMRREGTVLWGASEQTPGPAAYSPQKPRPERPSFTIQGIRREKSHVLGPYSSL